MSTKTAASEDSDSNFSPAERSFEIVSAAGSNKAGKPVRLGFAKAEALAATIRGAAAFKLAAQLALGFEIQRLKESYGVGQGQAGALPEGESWEALVAKKTGYAYSTVQKWIQMGEALADKKKTLNALVSGGDPARVLSWLQEETANMTAGELKEELGLITRRAPLELTNGDGKEFEYGPADGQLGGQTAGGGRKKLSESKMIELSVEELEEITGRLHQFTARKAHKRVPFVALGQAVDSAKNALRLLQEELEAKKEAAQKEKKGKTVCN